MLHFVYRNNQLLLSLRRPHSSFRPNRSESSDSGLLLQTDCVVGLSVCLCVCVLVTLITFMSFAKTADPIKMPFGGLTQLGLNNHVLNGVQIPTEKGQILKAVHFVQPIQNHWRSRCNLLFQKDNSIRRISSRPAGVTLNFSRREKSVPWRRQPVLHRNPAMRSFVKFLRPLFVFLTHPFLCLSLLPLLTHR